MQEAVLQSNRRAILRRMPHLGLLICHSYLFIVSLEHALATLGLFWLAEGDILACNEAATKKLLRRKHQNQMDGGEVIFDRGESRDKCRFITCLSRVWFRFLYHLSMFVFT